MKPKEKAFIIYSVIRKAYVIRASTEEEARERFMTGDADFVVADEIVDEEFENDGLFGLKVERVKDYDELIGKEKK
jgi:hypothetical protein